MSMFMENGSELVLHLTNCTRCGELNADGGADDGDRALVASAAPTLYSMGLVFVERTYLTPTLPLPFEEITANIDTFATSCEGSCATLFYAQFAVLPLLSEIPSSLYSLKRLSCIVPVSCWLLICVESSFFYEMKFSS